MKDESIKEKVFSGMIWKFGESILSQFVSFLISIVLARILMPEEYGIISMILIFITIADVFVTSGFSTALIQKKDATDKDFSTIFYCSLTVSIIIYLILFVSAPVIANFYEMQEITCVLRVLALRIIISSYNSVQHAYVSKNMIFKKCFFSTLFGTIISGVVGIILALNGSGVWALVAQTLTNMLIDSIVLTCTINWHPKLMFSYSSAKNLMKFGWKVLCSDLFGTFFDQIRSLVIGKLYTTTDLAYYNKGKSIPTLVSNNLNSTIMTVLFPAITNQNDKVEKVKTITKKATKMIAYMIAPIMIGLIVVARPLLILLLTEKWSESIIYMQLIALNYIVSIIGMTSLQTIKATGRSDILLKLEFIKKPIFLILLILGALNSVLGIAITGVIYAFISSIINAYAMGKIVNYNLVEQFKDIIPCISLATCMGILVYLVSLINLPSIVILALQLIIGTVFYISMSIIFKFKEFNEIKNFFLEKIKL